MIDRITECVRLGLSKKDAALHVGVATDTLNSWIRRGGAERRHIDNGGKPRKRESAFLKLLVDYEKATADFQLERLKIIDGAAKTERGKLPPGRSSAGCLRSGASSGSTYRLTAA